MSALSFGGELSHLLADGSHLFAVVGIVGDETNLRTHRRAAAASIRGLLERSTHSLRVIHPLGPHHVQRSSARIIEPYVQRASHEGSVARIVLQATLRQASTLE